MAILKSKYSKIAWHNMLNDELYVVIALMFLVKHGSTSYSFVNREDVAKKMFLYEFGIQLKYKDFKAADFYDDIYILSVPFSSILSKLSDQNPISLCNKLNEHFKEFPMTKMSSRLVARLR